MLRQSAIGSATPRKGASPLTGTAPRYASALSFHSCETGFDMPGLDRMKFVRLIAHGAGIESRVLSRGHNHGDQERDAQVLEPPHKLLPLLIPFEQHTNAAADRPDMLDDHVRKIAEQLVPARLDGREYFQHLLGT